MLVSRIVRVLASRVVRALVSKKVRGERRVQRVVSLEGAVVRRLELRLQP